MNRASWHTLESPLLALEVSDAGVFVLGSDFTVEWVNEPIEDYFGLSRSGVGGEDERDRVFEYGHTTAEDGNGLGLAIVTRIVEAHGWKITVTESDAGGARFEITGVEFV
jgi:sensor histidine kinase regulating citrate/malate metabolism